MVLWWGPEFHFIYNDAYRPFLGDKHPALGKPGSQVWGEVWQIIGGPLQSVLDTGQSTYSQDELLPLNRRGYLEETYYSYSLSPLHDDAGAVRGVFTAVSDTTDGIIGARRLAALNEIGAVASRARHLPEALRMLTEVLGRCGPDVPFAAAFLREDGSGKMTPRVVSPAGGTDVTRAMLARWPVGDVMRSGQPVTISGLDGQYGSLPSGGWATSPTDAMVLPLTGDLGSAPIGAMVLAASAGRALDDGYASFLSLVAQQTAAVINSALAYESQRARAEELAELAGLRSYEARWRAALINSISEAFFVLDDDGAVVEINDAFAEVLGYGRDGVPYRPRYPWWPPPDRFPEAHARVAEAQEQMLRQSRGDFIAPMMHRDGHLLWVEATFNEIPDPDSGRRMVAGTLRDVTTEHYAGQRESALAAMGMLLARADNVDAAIAGAIGELRRLWRARRVLAVAWDGRPEPEVVSTDGAERWPDLPAGLRTSINALKDRPLLTPTTGDQASAGITLDYPGGLLALWLDLDPAVPYTAGDRTLLALLCGYLGPALHRLRQADEQRATVIAMQRAFLSPAQLPPGFAARYEPAAPPLEIGGDWYDVAELPDGRIGIVVGDCVGHALESAITMGQLRSACRAMLLQDVGPAQTLKAMDKFAAVIPGGMSSTVFCGVLEPRTGDLVYSSAGHPPPIVAQPGGEIRLLDEARSPALGVLPYIERSEARWHLRPRATLLLYTDGLVERRRARLDVGIAQAAEVLAAGRPDPVRDVADRLMTQLAPAAGYEDDIALLIYRYPGPLELRFPAGTDQLAPARADLRDWLGRCNLSVRTAQDVLIAAGEAVANAYEHGSGGASGQPITLTATATATDLYLTVTDRGRWKDSAPIPGAYRGHGLPLMRTLMTEVTVSPGQDGTMVAMRLRITP